MKKWETEIRAIDPNTGELKLWGGDTIEAPTLELAQQWCDNNYKGYLKVVGELIMEIPCKKNTFEPDWKNKIDYEIMQQN